MHRRPFVQAWGLLVFLAGICPATTTATGSCDCSQSFLIGAFNTNTFGRTKMGRPAVAARMKQIVERYDVLLLQEIRDKSEESVKQLHGMLTGPFDFVISQPIGRTTYKEQYAFFYRTDRILLLDTYQYDDPDDVFEREPYTVLIAPKALNSQKLALIGLHSKPEDAVAEIGNLTNVIDQVLQQLGADVEPIVMGDLNADCRYAALKKRQAANDELTTNSTYTWLIGDEVDTTVRCSTNCAYDRIIVRSELASRVVAGSASTFDFCDAMALTSDECSAVSDHYPVEMLLEF